MNKIFKVIYSKTRHCYVVVSELAKSHCKTTQSHTARSKTALTAAVLLALGAFSFVGMPVVQAADGTESLRNNDFVGANDQYWYYDEGDKEWKTYQYKLTSAFNNRARGKLPNYQGGGAKFPGAVTAGLYAQAGQQTVTIGDRNAGQSKGSVFIGEHSGYNNGNNDPAGMKNNYVTSVGFQSDATGWGSIAIGSNATAENSKMESQVVEEVGNANTSGTVSDDTYGIKENPTIQGASVALGYNAHSKDGNIAIGAYSDATTDLSDDTSDKAKSYLTKNNATSYVSVGSKDVQRRISNVADGAADSDAATIAQLKEAVKATDASKKANIDASNIGKNLKFKADGKTAADSSDITTNENDWGTAIGTGKVEDKNGQLVTGGTVYNALQQQADNLKVNAGWGINVADENDPTNTGKKTKNVISLKHNLGTGYNDDEANGMIIGGLVEDRDPAKQYGAADANSVIVGAGKALASGKSSVVVGGLDNVASGATSVVVGGDNNNAAGNQSAVFGGRDNKAAGIASTASGGIMNAAVGQQATAIGGSLNYVLGANATAVGGLGRDYANGEVVYDSAVRGGSSVGIAGGSTGENAIGALAAGHQAVVTTENGTAIGYQATTDEANTIAFGHDADDVSGYTIEWNKLPENQVNADGTTNDYTKAPKSITPTTYKDAYYNRLVKVADGQDDHDVVVMEQLKQYANKDALNIGSNIKVYKTDGKGNVQVEDKDATTNAQNANKNAWGKALGAEKFSKGTTTTATNASTSDQLVTGKTLYNYDAPVAETGKKLNYVSANNTTGQNLSALDAQVKANADELNKPNRNIKYYSVKTLPLTVDGYTNENNDGAKGMGSLAAGFVTHADGIASTVAGSYSGVINSGNVQGRDLRGAAALSYGTFNVNQNTDTAKEHSGVANSIVGQANMTTDSNAAIIYGAGNMVTNSYRKIDDTNASEIMQAALSKNVKKLGEALQKAVPKSGAQVMVMGGGNVVDKAYMTQVTGVGNTVTGADSTYSKGTSTQYNFVDGFQNELANGKHDYIIGSNNKVSGESIDKNQSNIVFGDNHKLTNQKNNVIIGSSDTADDEMTASDVVAIGHNAKVSAEGGVAIGSGSEATVEGNKVAGYDPATGTNSTNTTSATWQATNGAVSVGKADGTVTRQINGVAAGTDETDAVNVAQLKTAQTGLINKGLTFAANTGEYTAKLGSKVTIQGSAKKADHTYTSDNLTTEVDDQGNIKILMDENMSADKIIVGKDGKQGHIELTGADGTNGKDGTSAVDITVKKGYDDTAKGINGTNGVDGKDGISRIVYEDGTGEHQIATMEDGLKFKGDDETVISKKLNNTLEIIGGAKDNLTKGNIGVVSENGKLNVRLAKDLTGLNSTTYTTTTGEGESATTSTTVVNGNGLTITDGPSITNKGIDGGNKVITNVGSGIETDANGKYTVTDQNKGNAANIGDVQNMVNEAVNSAADTTNKALAGKANIDASNIGANLKNADGSVASAEDQKTNAEKWGSAIGTGEIKADDGRMVTGKTVYDEVRPKVDGSYVKKDKTTGENLSALDSKIGSLDKDGNYIKKDDSISNNLSALDTHVKANENAIKQNSESIQNITNNVKNLSDNAVQYDKDSNKTTVTLAGKGGTTITNVKDGALSDSSTDAVNGKQLYKEVHVDSDGSYIKSNNTVGQNLSALDSGLKTTSDLIHTNDKGDTIQIGADSKTTKIDISGKDAKGNKTGRVITGVVSDANDPNSAANVGYVNGLTAANTQQIYRDMNNAYSRLDTNINRAAAGSNALAALHPLDFDPADKASFAVGYGHYRNANAAAVGAFYQPNANTMVNMGISLGNGDPGFNAGVSFKIGKGSTYNGVSKAEMAQTIHDQAMEISAIKADDAAKDKRIDALEKENQEMKKQIQEILARLNG
ncbi:ESPR-type extended signal peptide-containing protein [Dialister succinatiphilus]|uniref:ESPR-type extended signal peptide-containing protein n=1 Tax=Dialister succinatiphilus TaxID=487173 RepID=UPI00307AA1C0